MKWVNQGGGLGYLKCSHIGRSKKINESITDHGCCGRCNQGRDCLRDAQNIYDGVGSFFHTYWETVLNPGVCATCGEPLDAH